MAGGSVADWGNTMGDGRLGKMMRGGSKPPPVEEEGDRLQVLTTTWAPSPVIPVEEEPIPTGTNAWDSLILLPPLMPSLQLPLLPPEDPELSPCTPSNGLSGVLSTFKLHLGRRSWHRSQAMWFIKKLPGRCMPPLRYPQHATGWRRWRITTCHLRWPLNWQTPLPAAEGCKVCHSGHQSWPAAAYYHLCSALQYWPEEVHAPVPGQPHHLAGSVQELQQAVEPLVCFWRGEVFMTMAPSNWMEVPCHGQWRPQHRESWKSST